MLLNIVESQIWPELESNLCDIISLIHRLFINIYYIVLRNIIIYGPIHRYIVTGRVMPA